MKVGITPLRSPELALFNGITVSQIWPLLEKRVSGNLNKKAFQCAFWAHNESAYSEGQKSSL